MEYIIRDSKFAREKYAQLIGSKVRKLLLFEEQNSYLVKIISFPAEGKHLRAYEKENFLVHIDDLESLGEEEVFVVQPKEEHPPPSSIVIDPYVGQLILIGEEYADKMDYRAYVGAEAVIWEIRSSIAQVYVLSAEQSISERVLDIHITDIWSKPVEENQPVYLLVHKKGEFFYYTRERKLAVECYEALKKSNKWQDYFGKEVKDLADFIGDKGYLPIDMEKLKETLTESR